MSNLGTNYTYYMPLAYPPFESLSRIVLSRESILFLQLLTDVGFALCWCVCLCVVGFHCQTFARLEATIAANQEDLKLWKIVVDKWESNKISTLATAGLSSSGFDHMVDSFKALLRRFETNPETACRDELEHHSSLFSTVVQQPNNQRQAASSIDLVFVRMWKQRLTQCSAYHPVSEREACMRDGVVPSERDKCLTALWNKQHDIKMREAKIVARKVQDAKKNKISHDEALAHVKAVKARAAKATGGAAQRNRQSSP